MDTDLEVFLFFFKGLDDTIQPLPFTDGETEEGQ